MVHAWKRRTQVSFTRLTATFEDLVNHGAAVHKSCIFSKIIMRFDEVDVVLAIISDKSNLLGLLEGRHDLDFVTNTWHSKMSTHHSRRTRH